MGTWSQTPLAPIEKENSKIGMTRRFGAGVGNSAKLKEGRGGSGEKGLQVKEGGSAGITENCCYSGLLPRKSK